MNLVLYVDIGLMVILTIATFFDILNNHYIPLFIPIIGFVIRLIELALFESENLKEHIIVSVIVFVMLILMCYLGDLGGADCLLGTVCALYIGLDALAGMLLAFMLALPYAINMKFHNNEHEYAFTPYIWIGMLMIILLKVGGFKL